MKFRYQLTAELIEKTSRLEDFANGGTQVTLRLLDGGEVGGVLISNSMYIAAVRGFKDLPFSIDQIADIYQTADDRNPSLRSEWEYFDKWK